MTQQTRGTRVDQGSLARRVMPAAMERPLLAVQVKLCESCQSSCAKVAGQLFFHASCKFPPTNLARSKAAQKLLRLCSGSRDSTQCGPILAQVGPSWLRLGRGAQPKLALGEATRQATSAPPRALCRTRSLMSRRHRNPANVDVAVEQCTAHLGRPSGHYSKR